jgi:beta-glucanase (GH16 family)
MKSLPMNCFESLETRQCLSVAPTRPTAAWTGYGTGTDIVLKWADASNNETGFELQISRDGNTYSRLAKTASNKQSYTVKNLVGNTSYWFRVRAFNGFGNSSWRRADAVITRNSPVLPAINNDFSRQNAYTLSFRDEFNGSSLDTNKWNYRQLGRRNDAINTQDAVSVNNGNLTIQVYTENNTHYAGMISTENSHLQTYGYFEARIKFDTRPGMWSAFWVQSPDMVGSNSLASRNPGRSDLYGTEMDIVEHRVVDQNNTPRQDIIDASVHMDGYDANQKTLREDSININADSGYHTYGMEWTSDALRFYIDGNLFWAVDNNTARARGISTSPISGRSEYVILSTEVRNNSWAGNIPSGGYGSKSTSTTKMTVDWVRVYRKK